MEIIFEDVLIMIIKNMDVVRILTCIVIHLFLLCLYLGNNPDYNGGFDMQTTPNDSFGYMAIWLIVYVLLEVVAKAYNG